MGMLIIGSQPQRPLKAFKVRDENMALPAAITNKTILQRNKSSPALSTLVQVGALKAAAKRTAFADVSNTLRPPPPSKDDVALLSKETNDAVESATIQVQDTHKPATLLRPAQRPLSNMGPKSSTDSMATIIEETKQPVRRQTVSVSNSRLVQAVDNAPKDANKKTTTVFKDVPDISKVSISNESTATVNSHTAPLLQDLVTGQQKIKTEIRAESSKNEPSSSPDHAPVVSSGISVRPQEQAQEKLQDNGAAMRPLYVDAVESQDQQNTYDTISLEAQAQLEYLADLESKATALNRTCQAEIVVDPQLPGVPDLEDWVGEDGEPYYEDGYTTARSLRLRSDGNTTGGVTVVLNPKVTARVERELAAAKEIVESSRTEEDIEDEAWDTSMVAEYGDEIFQYMRTLEERMRPNPHYMDNQAEIQWSMRSVLMDWLVQVHHRFQLLPETLFLSVNYVDRFLSCKVVSLGKLQLVGATAIFVAAKYEEINCPAVQEIVYMVDNGYSTEEILKAERFMLSMLQFELGWPGPMSFLRRISKADDYDLETRTLAKYFLEITIMDERFVGCTPSFTAAGAHCLARLMLRKGDWSPAHVHYSGYTYSQLRQLISVILECCEDPHKHHAYVFEKYTDKRYKQASIYVEKEINKGFQLPSMPRDSIAGFRDSASLPWKRKS
ncbi:hypothetical protein EV356DRAFT_209909 [Viridothelium virens]|uniref:Uncharacterized protein n=1 Tax=Viridothelium virens TaxID=1048519 RepID=A0A6A6H5Q1_VIRVR|nr:hypothetical protein EV356DRAFT_209909 [Viridothelium virens]